MMIVYVKDLQFKIFEIEIHEEKDMYKCINTVCANACADDGTYYDFCFQMDRCYEYKFYQTHGIQFFRIAMKYPDGFMMSLTGDAYQIMDPYTDLNMLNSWQPTQNEIRLHKMKHVIEMEKNNDCVF